MRIRGEAPVQLNTLRHRFGEKIAQKGGVLKDKVHEAVLPTIRQHAEEFKEKIQTKFTPQSTVDLEAVRKELQNNTVSRKTNSASATETTVPEPLTLAHTKQTETPQQTLNPASETPALLPSEEPVLTQQDPLLEQKLGNNFAEMDSLEAKLRTNPPDDERSALQQKLKELTRENDMLLSRNEKAVTDESEAATDDDTIQDGTETATDTPGEQVSKELQQDSDANNAETPGKISGLRRILQQIDTQESLLRSTELSDAEAATIRAKIKELEEAGDRLFDTPTEHATTQLPDEWQRDALLKPYAAEKAAEAATTPSHLVSRSPEIKMLYEQYDNELDPIKRSAIMDQIRLTSTLQIPQAPKITDDEYLRRLRVFGEDRARLDHKNALSESIGDMIQRTDAAPPIDTSGIKTEEYSKKLDAFAEDRKEIETKHTAYNKSQEARGATEQLPDAAPPIDTSGIKTEEYSKKLAQFSEDREDIQKRFDTYHKSQETQGDTAQRPDAAPPIHTPPPPSKELQQLYKELDGEMDEKKRIAIKAKIKDASPEGFSSKEEKVLETELRPAYKTILSESPRNRDIGALVRIAQEMQKNISATTQGNDNQYRSEMQKIIGDLNQAWRNIPLRSTADRDVSIALQNEIQLLTRQAYGQRTHPEAARHKRRFNRLRNIAATTQRTVF